METDTYNAIATIGDELFTARRTWVLLPSGRRLNLARLATVYWTTNGDGRRCLRVVWGDIANGGWDNLYGEDTDALLRALDGVTR